MKESASSISEKFPHITIGKINLNFCGSKNTKVDGRHDDWNGKTALGKF